MNRVIKDDLAAIRKEFAVPRRTRIEDGPEAVYVENAVPIQEVVFVMDRFGYCKLWISLLTNGIRKRWIRSRYM